MTNNKPNDVRVVPVELLEKISQTCMFTLPNSDYEQLRAILAQPADQHIPFPGYPPVPDDRKLPADQQGEPVAWLNEATGHVTTSSVVVMDWDDEKEPVQSLYRHAQPATAKVVLPERLDLPHRDEFESADQHAAAVGEANAYNACLDEVAKLNGGVK